MAPPAKHRLSPAKIPLDLHERFEIAKAVTGHTHTEAIEKAIELYVAGVKRKAKWALE